MTANDVCTKNTALTIAGLALILVPVIAAGVKFASFGWMMFFFFYMLVIPASLIIGWVMQIVIATTGFFGKNAPFATHARRRGIAAAWTTSGGVLLFALAFVDGGDTTWGSTLMYMIGAGGDRTVGDISTGLTWFALIPWVGGWLWLLVEWIGALVARSRRRRMAV